MINPAILWSGKGLDEIGVRADTGEVVVKVDPRYFRPAEVDTLLGDASKARAKLGWEPKTNLNQMIKEMVENDLKESNKEVVLKEKGLVDLDFERT